METAARFRDLNAEPPQPKRARLFFPGHSEEERLCWCVIGYLETQLSNRPDQTARVGERLRVELREHLDLHGRVILPEQAEDPRR